MINSQAPYVRHRPLTYSYTRPLHSSRTALLTAPVVAPRGMVAKFMNFARQLFD